MALPSWAAAGRPVTSPRAAMDLARALAVAATRAVACTRPRLANSSADPVYSGTSWMRSAISAGSTSSRVPRSGRTRTGYPFAARTSAYTYARRTLSGKLNDPTVITADGPRAAGRDARLPPVVQAAQATARARQAPRASARSSGIGLSAPPDAVLTAVFASRSDSGTGRDIPKQGIRERDGWRWIRHRRRKLPV